MEIDYLFAAIVLAFLLLWVRYDLFSNVLATQKKIINHVFFGVRLLFISFAFVSIQWLILSDQLGSTSQSPNDTTPQVIHVHPKPPHAKTDQQPESKLDAEVLKSHQITTRFTDVAGLEEVKTEIQEIVDFYNNSEKFLNIGAVMPKGTLLYGPTGTGKTLIARALAGEANVTFISVSGSAFDQKWVGLGAQRVRELFELARKHKPCIVFIDEIDALAPIRNSLSDAGGKVQTVNQLLTEMDNIDEKLNEGIFILGATNRLESVDTAILRPGRFDRKVFVRLPNLVERQEIINIYLDKIEFEENVSAKSLAGSTPGFSGADLRNLVNEAAIYAARNNRLKANSNDFEYAKDKITLGMEVKTAVVPFEEKRNTAYHEAGHAIVGILSPNFTLKFNKVTIGLRNQTLGVTHFEIQKEGYSVTRGFLEDRIATALGGRVAEELVFGRDKVTSGAQNDMQVATKIARDMVVSYGLSDLSNVLSFDTLSDFGYPSDDIYKEIEKILNQARVKAKKILQQNRRALDVLANTLIKKETLDFQEVMQILKQNPPRSAQSSNIPLILASPFE